MIRCTYSRKYNGKYIDTADFLTETVYMARRLVDKWNALAIRMQSAGHNLYEYEVIRTRPYLDEIPEDGWVKENDIVYFPVKGITAMNKTAHELLKLAREMIASDLDDFLQAWKSGGYSYMGFYSGKTRPTKNPNNFLSLQPFTPAVEERARQMVVEPKRFVKTPDYAFFTFVGTAGRTDTYLLSKKPLAELFPDAVPVRKRVYEIAEDIKRKLSDKGLQSLGTRYGKAGEQFGEPDSARRIGIGGRDFLFNGFMVQIDDEFSFKKPTIGWRMKHVVLLSAVTDETIDKAVAWVNAGPTMQQVRDKARNEYLRKTAEKPGERNFVIEYGW